METALDNPLTFGWNKDDHGKSLGAVPLPQDVPLATAELKMIQCMCSRARLSDVDVQLVSFQAP